jgi:hypothetical protein
MVFISLHELLPSSIQNSTISTFEKSSFGQGKDMAMKMLVLGMAVGFLVHIISGEVYFLASGLCVCIFMIS